MVRAVVHNDQNAGALGMLGRGEGGGGREREGRGRVLMLCTLSGHDDSRLRQSAGQPSQIQGHWDC
jgi:hypothetical protein